MALIFTCFALVAGAGIVTVGLGAAGAGFSVAGSVGVLADGDFFVVVGLGVSGFRVFIADMICVREKEYNEIKLWW